MSRTARLILINLTVLLGLALAVEAGFRAVRLVQSCFSAGCNTAALSLANTFQGSRNADKTLLHPVLGYVPKPGFSGAVEGYPGTVAITPEGFRSNGGPPPAAGRRLLAVGDSFTFGDEVADAETWPACVERRTGLVVHNAGVPGYGAVQAVLRAEIEHNKHRHDTVIWSILVGSSFGRDRLTVRAGRAVPTVVDVEAGPTVLPPKAQSPDPPWYHPLGRSYAFRWVHGRFTGDSETRYDGRWDVVHPRAAPSAMIEEAVVARFAAMPGVRRKLMLLQYARVPDAALKEQAERLKGLAALHGLEVVDSAAFLHSHPPTALWDGHHTALGNMQVCEALIQARTKAILTARGDEGP